MTLTPGTFLSVALVFNLSNFRKSYLLQYIILAMYNNFKYKK